MNRIHVVAAVACLLLACSAPPPGNDAGTDAGGPLTEIDVAGTVLVHPDGVAVLADAGLTLAIAGLTARVEEPLRVALNDPSGVFSTATLTAAGTFSATAVPLDLVNVGLAVGVRDDSDAGTASRVARSATVIFDVPLEASKPTASITGAKAYAVPALLHEKLNQAVGLTKLRQLATEADAGALIQAGFILGRVVDAQNQPVGGVTIVPLDAAKTERFLYPTADFSGLGTATSSNGLFVYVHTGGAVQPPFKFNVVGATGYKARSAGAAADAALVLIVYPGTTVP